MLFVQAVPEKKHDSKFHIQCHLSIGHSLLWCYIHSLWLRAPEAEQGAPKSLGVFWVLWHRNFGNSITARLWKDHSCIQGLGKQKQTSREWDGERLILSSREAFKFENQQHCKLGHRSVQALGKCQLSLCICVRCGQCPAVTVLLWAGQNPHHCCSPEGAEHIP